MKKIVICCWVFLFIPALTYGQTIDFDSMVAGEVVTEINGVLFDSNTGLPLIVSNLRPTTSGENYLGVDDGGSELFQDYYGDEIYLTFLNPVIELSVSFIGVYIESPLYEILTPEGTAVNSGPPIPLDRNEVFRVTFSSLTAFTEATLKGSGELLSYSIDDIEIVYANPVPEPGTGILFITGLIGMSLWRRNKSH